MEEATTAYKTCKQTTDDTHKGLGDKTPNLSKRKRGSLEEREIYFLVLYGVNDDWLLEYTKF